MTYTVTADFLDHIVKEAGEYPDGRPKVIEELHEGDTSDLSDVDEARIQVLKDCGAIKDSSEVEQDKDAGDEGMTDEQNIAQAVAAGHQQAEPAPLDESKSSEKKSEESKQRS